MSGRQAAIRKYYAMKGASAKKSSSGTKKKATTKRTYSYPKKSYASGGWSAANVGSAIGSAVGSMVGGLGGVAAPAIGYMAGSALSKIAGPSANILGSRMAKKFSEITGWGDYQIYQNSLVYPDRMVPSFGEDSIRVRKREYIGDINATTTFTSRSFPINPGLVSSFPWLSSIAKNYEQYKINGMVFQFLSTSSAAISSTTNLGMGMVLMATDYDSQHTFINSPQMMGSMFSNSGKPSEDIMHAIECAPDQQAQKLYYVRTGTVPANESAKLYDLGNFQIATDKMPANYNGAGQLWVTYDITFVKSCQDNQLGLDLRMDQYYITGITNGNPFGTTRSLRASSNLGTSVTSSTVFAFPTDLPAGTYMLIIRWNGTSAAMSVPTWVFNNCTQRQVFLNNTAAVITAGSGVTSTDLVQAWIIRIDLSPATISVTGGTFPGTPTADLIITQVNAGLYP